MTQTEELLTTLQVIELKELPTWIEQHRSELNISLLNELKSRAEAISQQGEITVAIQWLERGTVIAEILDDPCARALIWRGRANVLERGEQYEESLVAVHHAVAIYSQHGTDFDIAVARVIEIYVLGALERFDEAIPLAYWVRAQFEKEDTDYARRGLAHVAANLGAIYTQTWQLEKAMEEHQRALRLYRQLGMSEQAAWTLHDLGLTAERLDRLADARHYYEEALPELTRANYVFLLIKMHFNLAKISQREGDYEAALRHLAQARQSLMQRNYSA